MKKKRSVNCNYILRLGWSHSVSDTKIDFVDHHNGRFYVGVCAIIKVFLRDGASHEDLGYGVCEGMKSKANSIQKARKEAITDGVKRALKAFGTIFGVGLNDKSYSEALRKMAKQPMKYDPGDFVNDTFAIDHRKLGGCSRDNPDATANSTASCSGQSSSTRRNLLKGLPLENIETPSAATETFTSPTDDAEAARQERLRKANMKKKMYSDSRQKRKREEEEEFAKPLVSDDKAVTKKPAASGSGLSVDSTVMSFMTEDDDIFENLTQMETSVASDKKCETPKGGSKSSLVSARGSKEQVSTPKRMAGIRASPRLAQKKPT